MSLDACGLLNVADILLMEDNCNLADLLIESFEASRYSVVWFQDASSAIQYLELNRVDLVVTDISVQKNGRSVSDGGIRLISRLRLMRRFQANVLPIIAISGSYVLHGMGDVLKIAKQVGANATLEKPFGPDDLLAEIKRLL